jgi:hypothetical protein
VSTIQYLDLVPGKQHFVCTRPEAQPIVPLDTNIRETQISAMIFQRAADALLVVCITTRMQPQALPVTQMDTGFTPNLCALQYRIDTVESTTL